MNPLRQLEACDQSPWLDYLKRSLIENGMLDGTLVAKEKVLVDAATTAAGALRQAGILLAITQFVLRAAAA